MRRSFPHPAVSLAALAAAACLVAGVLVAVGRPGAPADARPEAAAAAAVSDRQVDLERFTAPGPWKAGGTRTKFGRKYDVVRWKSRWVTPGFDFTELIASWSARTPGTSWIEVQVRGRSAAGARTSWDTLARWAAKDKKIERRSGGAQADDGTRVATDTWRTAGLASYKIRIRAHHQRGRKVPKVAFATAMTSRLPAGVGAVSAPGVASAAGGLELAVPRYSQMVHAGHYPQWGGGGEAWCSPTSTAMVLGYYGRLPGPGSYSWVPAGHPDPWVDATARATYDHAYKGTGNWPFNTAFAAKRVGEAFVTRLRDLTDAELLVRAGIPPVVSIAFARGELTGAPISSSNGHLLVIVGFTATGDVIVNDPAAAGAAGVRRVYPRAQLEKIWLRASGGMAYVIHDAAHPLPPSPGGNW
ncbi:C39 family peptidase [Nocardioides humi]|uniref:C39 family peptidase n=1 Tax=Nocardioides humi TaxID=449461 RepID=UPI0011273C9F|nr:C39 family peptidase [Nocardioides humi]